MLKQEFVKVKFIEGEWMGNKPPATMTILKTKAVELESRGVVKILDSGIANKAIKEPPMNKMVSEPSVSKSISAKPKGRRKTK